VQQLRERSEGRSGPVGTSRRWLVQVGPGCRKQGARAVGQDDDEPGLAVTIRVPEDLEGVTLERMTGPNDYGSRGAFGREVVVGSVSGGLSTPFLTIS
jgi:hypothetical protein